MRYTAVINDREIAMEINSRGEVVSVTSDEGDTEIDVRPVSASRYSILLNGRSYILDVEKNVTGYYVRHRNRALEVQVKDEMDEIRERYGMGDALAEMHGMVQAPIPGRVVMIEVQEGDEVQPDDGLLILEAMKMENEIRAPVGGVVTRIHVTEGQSIEKDTLLVEIETE